MSPVQIGEGKAADGARSETPVHGQSVVAKEIPFGQYVFHRLLSSGAKSIFGVPGDFNLPLLEYMYEDELVAEGLEWIGTCNELNSAYAADGYSRYTSKLGCVISTYGVGELSALNGIAGAFAEDVKVLHIVGVSPVKFREQEKLRSHNVHHLIPAKNNREPPNHKVYYEMVKDSVSCSSAFLEDLSTACDQVDKVIADIYRHSKPGYLFIPVDFADKMVSNKNLLTNPVIDLDTVIDKQAAEEPVKEAGEKVLEWIYQSKTPAVFSDNLVDRFALRSKLRELIEATRMWNYTSLMGKSTLDEDNDDFYGIYVGSESGKEMQAIVDANDLVLHFGPNKNEVNCGYYSYKFSESAKLIELYHDVIKFVDPKEGSFILEANFVSVLDYVVENLDSSKCSFGYPTIKKSTKIIEFNNEDDITQNSLKKIMPEYYNDGDVFVAETGSFQFSVPYFKFGKEMKYVTQSFYLSIGMALPAALGVGRGMHDYPRSHIVNQSSISEKYVPRLILCIGDGAAQMTVQEIASFIRYKVPVEILIWNNNGYTVERVIKGPTRSYNDIAPFKWSSLLNVFGDFENKLTESVTVSSNQQIIDTLAKWKKDESRSKIKLAEVMLGVMDIPEELVGMVLNCKPK